MTREELKSKVADLESKVEAVQEKLTAAQDIVNSEREPTSAQKAVVTKAKKALDKLEVELDKFKTELGNMETTVAKEVVEKEKGSNRHFNDLHEYLNNGKNKQTTDIVAQQRVTLLNVLSDIATSNSDEVIEIFDSLSESLKTHKSIFSPDTGFSTVAFWTNLEEGNAYTTILTIVNMLSNPDYKGYKIDPNTAGNIISEVNNEAGERIRYFLSNLPKKTSEREEGSR